MKKIYSEEFKNVLLHTRTEAYKGTEKLIRADHFVLGMLHAPDNDAYELIAGKTDALEALRTEIKDHLKTYSPAHVPFDMPEGAINLDMDASVALQGSMDESNMMHTDKVMSIHLLLALIKNKESFLSQTLAKYGITYEYARSRAYDLYHLDENDENPFDIKKELLSDIDDELDELDEEGEEEVENEEEEMRERYTGSDVSSDKEASELAKSLRGGILFMGKKKSSKSLDFLSRYGNDMTTDVVIGKIDPIVGREKEIERLSQILSRRKKNNPILIGEAGVGKTAIVEGLARNIVCGDVPVALRDKRIFSLNMAAVVAGTKYRGQFEERLQGIVKELREHPEIILFIDEIHNIIGAGSSQGTMDAANLLKPALSRGRLQCIGATTIDEYRKTIEKDGALERRFQKIMVNPTTPSETIAILNKIKNVYEDFHSVNYTDKAIEACVRLTDRYISDRKLPDKAIDALDEAGSRKHMTGVKMPDELKNLEKEIALCKELKREAAESKHFEEANNLRDKIAELQEKYGEKKAQWLISLKDNPCVVDEKDIEQVVSIMSGVPVHKMAQAENVRLKQLQSDLKQTIIAQDKAIDKLVKAITRNRIGLREPNKPIGTFLFLGPTGVGKTYLAKKLADYMFGSEDALIRIDMSEYMEKFSTSRLVGAPPGYVGYEEGGQLTERVRRRPYSIVLLDEIEKANKDVFNLLLQVMDEGRLTDSNGVTVDFRNTIIILTSNCGSRDLQDFGNGVGFNTQSEQELKKIADSIIMKALNKQFAPEFINRIDDIIVFDNLSRDSIARIIDNELSKLNLRTTALGFSIEIDKKAKEFLVDKSYDRKYGARPLKRAIQTYIEDGISDYILDERSKDNTSGVIHITRKPKKEELCFE